MLKHILEQMDRDHAGHQAKAARMAFGGTASLHESKLTAIINANDRPITKNGNAGAYQLFSYMYSARAYKVATAKAILNSRRAIRFNKIYRGYDLNEEIRSDVVMDHIADLRQRAFAAGV